jgi:predicted FMN-binding regulatory protein PaiB
VLDREAAPLGTVYFHLARSNPIASLAGRRGGQDRHHGSTRLYLTRWYDTPNQVPTWNYTAVEGSVVGSG